MWSNSNSIQALRDVGPNANNTSGNYGFVLNSAPDLMIIKATANKLRPLYPKVDMNDEKYQYSYQGLLAFSDARWKHQSRSREFNSDVDTVYYVDNLAGLYDEKDKPWEIVDHLRYLGHVQNDILKTEGSSKSNTLGWSSKATLFNTGPYRMYAGTPYMWEIPPTGADAPPTPLNHLPKNANPLWTVPYDDAIHKGSPQLLYKALTDTSGRFDESRSDHGLKRHAVQWVKAVAQTSVACVLSAIKRMVNRKNLEGVNLANVSAKQVIDVLLKAIAGGDNDPGMKGLVDDILNPTENLFFESNDDIPPISVFAGDSLADLSGKHRGATIFKGPSELYREKMATGAYNGNRFDSGSVHGFDAAARQRSLSENQQMTLCQIAGSENLFFYNVQVNTFYTRRIVGLVITSVDSGKMFDSIPLRML